jgi:hypothetical protein
MEPISHISANFGVNSITPIFLFSEMSKSPFDRRASDVPNHPYKI